MEIWKDIPEYEGLYQVSNLGRFKRFYKTSKERILKPQLNINGYQVINLWKNGKKKCCRVHRIVALAFIDNPDNKPTVDHIDRNPLNNNVENLRWATMKEQSANSNNNIENAHKAISKLVFQYNKQGSFIKEYPSACEASRQTGINQSHICRCCLGRRKSAGGYIWKHKKIEEE